MRIRFYLTPGIDDDLIALYLVVGNKGFIKILKNVYLSYCTGLPFFEKYDVSDVNVDSEIITIRVPLDEGIYAKLLSEYNLCSDKKKAGYLKAIARMYLTPSLLSYYQDTNEGAYIAPVTKKEKVEKPKKQTAPKKERKKAETTIKEAVVSKEPVVQTQEPVPTPVEPVPQPAQEQPNPANSMDMQAMMQNPQFQQMMAAMMAANMMAQTNNGVPANQTINNQVTPVPEAPIKTEPEPEDDSTEVEFDPNLMGLFGSVGSE